MVLSIFVSTFPVLGITVISLCLYKNFQAPTLEHCHTIIVTLSHHYCIHLERSRLSRGKECLHYTTILVCSCFPELSPGYRWWAWWMVASRCETGRFRAKMPHQPWHARWGRATKVIMPSKAGRLSFTEKARNHFLGGKSSTVRWERGRRDSKKRETPRGNLKALLWLTNKGLLLCYFLSLFFWLLFYFY